MNGVDYVSNKTKENLCYSETLKIKLSGLGYTFRLLVILLTPQGKASV